MCYRLILLLSALMCLLGLSGTPADAESGAAVQAVDAGLTPPLDLTPEERAWIAAHPRIVLGIDQDWAPRILRKPDGGFTGIDGDIVARLNALLGTRITFETGRWADLVEKLKTRQIDGLSSAAVHEERRAFADFTQPYMTDRKYLYARSDNATHIRSVENLTGKRIGYQSGNLFEQKTLASVPGVRAIATDSPQAAFAAALGEELDGFVGSITTEYQLQKSEAARLQPLFRLGRPLDLVFAIRKDWPELTALLDKGIAAISAEERLRIKDRYYRKMERRLVQVTVPLTDAERAWIEAHPRIALGIDQNWRPYVINNPDGRVTGIEADFLARINALTGLNLRIEQGVWKDMVERAKRKEIDGLLTSTYQKEREPYFLFSDPIYSTYKNVFARKGDLAVYRNISSLAGKRVGYQAGNAIEEKLLKNHPNLVIVPKADNAELLAALLQGEIDAVLSGVNFNYLLLERTVTEVGVAFFPPDSELVLRYSIRKDWPELQAIVNKALVAIPVEERLAITERYIGNIRAEKRPEPALALTDAEKRWLDAKRTVRVRVSDWPPYMFVKPAPSGMSVDYLDAVAKRFGIVLEYVPDTLGWPESMRDVKEERRHFDLILTMHRSPEREKDFALTENYLQMPWAIFARKDSPFIGGLDSLKGKTVAAEKGYFMTGKLKANHPDIKIVEVDRTQDALRALSSGQADAYVGNLANASFLIRELGLANLTVAAPTPYGDHTQAMAIRKDWPELASLIDKGLAAMTPDERDAINTKWDPQKILSRIDYALVWQVVAVATLILFAFLYWNRKLSREIARRQRIEADLRSSEAELKASEVELRRSRDAADSANRAKSMFLANMSHELRTPLNAVLGFSEMLARDRNATEDQKQKLGIINRSGGHLLEMINDILDLSKIEAGKTELAREPFELPRLLEDIGTMIRPRAESRGLSLTVDIAPDTARFVEADESKLRQILINLLGNSVKFTREGGVTLRARTRAEEGRTWLDLEVEDTGSGIPPESLETIFQPFVQAHAAADGKGTGLGLAITRSFVQMMGGRIAVASEPGQGSVFRVGVPLELSSAEAVAAPEAPAFDVAGLAEGQAAPRILVVEDVLENRLLVTGLLEQAGFAVHEAGNGEEAVTLFQRWRPNLVLMDMRMPVMDGFEATRRIRALPGGATVRIVALTASVFKEQRAEILEAGCDDIVPKPFHAKDLFAMLERFLGVRYRYAAAEAARSAPALRAEMLAPLPEALRQALFVAAAELDIEGAGAVIERIRGVDAALANGLQALMNDYRFTEILVLLDASDGHEPDASPTQRELQPEVGG
ncbi:MAG: transporter substrate-binding domain-containing protein [Candidatus Competibacter phosphatis]